MSGNLADVSVGVVLKPWLRLGPSAGSARLGLQSVSTVCVSIHSTLP